VHAEARQQWRGERGHLQSQLRRARAAAAAAAAVSTPPPPPSLPSGDGELGEAAAVVATLQRRLGECVGVVMLVCSVAVAVAVVVVVVVVVYCVARV